MRGEQDDRSIRLIKLLEAVTNPSRQGGNQKLLIMPALNHGERNSSPYTGQGSPDSVRISANAQPRVVRSERESDDTCRAIAHDFLNDIFDERVPVLHSNVDR